MSEQIEWLIRDLSSNKLELANFINDYFLLKDRADELEKERSEWKGKHSILKNKYKGLQRKMDSKWRYNRAVQNESKSTRAVLEKFRERNQRYKQALEYAQLELEYAHVTGNIDLRGELIKNSLKVIDKALEEKTNP